jgi:ribosomal RNA assembly protein
MKLNRIYCTPRAIKYFKKHKEIIEKTLNCKINFDKGDIIVNSEDYFVLEKIKMLSKAFDLGFDEKFALKLLDDEFILQIIDIKDYTKKPNDIKRILSRVIGRQGKTKEHFEKVGSVNIKITGSEIGIIGKMDNVNFVSTYILQLIEGAPHQVVYGFMAKDKYNFIK